MKKIERYRQVFSGDIINLKSNKPESLLFYCIVDEKALTKQEAYIEQLEREKEEAVNILIDLVSSKEYTAYCAYMDRSIYLSWQEWYEKNSLKKARDEIKKEVAFLESITGKTWEELKEERG